MRVFVCLQLVLFLLLVLSSAHSPSHMLPSLRQLAEADRLIELELLPRRAPLDDLPTGRSFSYAAGADRETLARQGRSPGWSRRPRPLQAREGTCSDGGGDGLLPELAFPYLQLVYPGQYVLTDVAVVHPLSAHGRRQPNTPTACVKSVQAAKRSKYAAIARHHDAEFIPVVVETCGGLGSDAIALLDVISGAASEHLCLWSQEDARGERRKGGSQRADHAAHRRTLPQASSSSDRVGRCSRSPRAAVPRLHHGGRGGRGRRCGSGCRAERGTER
jgi:hypothetical protein